MNIGTLLSRHARYRPHHLAFIFADQRFTFAQLNSRVNRVANALLHNGLSKGDKIATILPNSVELVELYWAAAKTGIVIVPLSPLLQAKALVTLLRDSDTKMVFATADFADTLASIKSELPAIEPTAYILTTAAHRQDFRYFPDFIENSHSTRSGNASDKEPPDASLTDSDIYNIIYSSGTTGDPKGIIHTHYVRAMYCTLFASAWRMRPESVILHAGSLVFNGAFLTFMPWMYLGATYILLPQANPEILIETIERERVTHTMMVPSLIIAMLNSPKFSANALESLEMLGTVGAPLHLEHKQRLNDALPNRFYELYGLTEGFVTILDKQDYATKSGSVGTPPPFFELCIQDEQGKQLATGEVGEIVGRGPILMPGYYKRDDLTTQAIVNGWLHTGDLGYVDADGFLFLVDRKKDLIISGGVNVYPRDIEEVVVQHPEIREVAVFGVPDEKWGEASIAAVVLKEPHSIDAKTLADWINHNVGAKFQRVREVIILEDLPRNTAGKTLKRVIRDNYLA